MTPVVINETQGYPMRIVLLLLFTFITIGLVGWLLYSIVFGRKEDWQLPLGFLIVFWLGSSILISVLQFIFDFGV